MTAAPTPPAAPAAKPFFTLNATYGISPDASGDALLNDAMCLLSTAESLAEELAFEGSGSSRFFAVLYLTQMARAVTAEGHARLSRAARQAAAKPHQTETHA